MRTPSTAFIVGMIFSSTAFAGWESHDIKDDLRGITSVHHVIKSGPVDGSEPIIEVRVISESKKPAGIIIASHSDRFASCADGRCKIPVRFDEGDVHDISFAQAENGSLIPEESGVFAGALSSATELRAEIKFKDGSTHQYKVDVSGLDVDLPEPPELMILGYTLGSSYAGSEPNMPKSVADGDRSCYKPEGVTKAFGTQPVNQAVLCFYRGIFYSALIVPGSKSAYAEGIKFLNAALGKPDSDSVYPTWPASSGKRISYASRSAFYLSTGDTKKYESPFIITDDSVGLLVKTTKK